MVFARRVEPGEEPMRIPQAMNPSAHWFRLSLPLMGRSSGRLRGGKPCGVVIGGALAMLSAFFAAAVAELADALGSGPSGGKTPWRFDSSQPHFSWFPHRRPLAARAVARSSAAGWRAHRVNHTPHTVGRRGGVL